MSIEAIAALLGHKSLDMTRQYARISNRVVPDEYAAVTAKVEALYTTTAALPASAEGPNMRRLRAEVNYRLLGNGLCTRPVELDCSFESICEKCAHFTTNKPSNQCSSDNETTPPKTAKPDEPNFSTTSSPKSG